MNGLCGQGYKCTQQNFCCRCPTGKSLGIPLFLINFKQIILGECVNGVCPAGYTCNSNNFCCVTGTSGAILGKCVNGLCPAGFTCGAGDLCYAVSSPVKNPLIASFRRLPKNPSTGSKTKQRKSEKNKSWRKYKNLENSEELQDDEEFLDKFDDDFDRINSTQTIFNITEDGNITKELMLNLKDSKIDK